jgi:acetyl-CoA carboxylase carboxyl transferase subunit alpha
MVDTRGADPSAPSEAGGIAWEIARLFEKMLSVHVPVLSVVTGEGGSGGALAFAVGDFVLVTHDSIFSVIAPEGAAEILWRDGDRAAEAARLLKLTASSLLEFQIADAVIPSPVEGSFRDSLRHYLSRIDTLTPGGSDRAPHRRRRWRDI